MSEFKSTEAKPWTTDTFQQIKPRYLGVIIEVVEVGHESSSQNHKVCMTVTTHRWERRAGHFETIVQWNARHDVLLPRGTYSFHNKHCKAVKLLYKLHDLQKLQSHGTKFGNIAILGRVGLESAQINPDALVDVFWDQIKQKPCWNTYQSLPYTDFI